MLICFTLISHGRIIDKDYENSLLSIPHGCNPPKTQIPIKENDIFRLKNGYLR